MEQRDQKTYKEIIDKENIRRKHDVEAGRGEGSNGR